jgi:tRNA G18 (ribose-2'-O)-methylase SpoU
MQKIFLTGITGTPPHREIHKTALGSTESVAWEYFEKTESILSKLKSEGYKIVVVEQTTESVSLQNFRIHKNEKYAFVFGNEVNGVSEEAIPLADTAIEIPQGGTKHSLNISVCLGIVMWEVAKQSGF